MNNLLYYSLCNTFELAFAFASIIYYNNIIIIYRQGEHNG